MKHLKGFSIFNEAIIDYNGNNIDELLSKIENQLRRSGSLEIQAVNTLCNEYGVDVVDYDTFFADLSEENKKTAPPKGAPQVPIFGLVKPESGLPRIVMQVPMLDERMFGHFKHIMTHENIHREQHNRSGKDTYLLPDPNDRKVYFSDKNEIMAFSHSIVDMSMNMSRPSDIQVAMKGLNRNPLYRDIKGKVDAKVLRRYDKYIYQYFEVEFDKLKK